MSRVSCRLPFALCLVLLFIAQARLNAAAVPSTEAFLATLAGQACLRGVQQRECPRRSPHAGSRSYAPRSLPRLWQFL